MDELTFLSGCVLAGMIARGPNPFPTDDDIAAVGVMRRMKQLAMAYLERADSDAQKQASRCDPDRVFRDLVRRHEGAPISDRDASAELAAIIEAVDEVGGWPTPEAKADADVVCWVRSITRDLSRAYEDLRQVRGLVGATADETAATAVRRVLVEQNTALEQSNQTQAALRCEREAIDAALRDAGANKPPPVDPPQAISALEARLHAKRIDAAQDAAENEVLKARNARLMAQQVRLLAALEKARRLAKCAAHLNNEVDVIKHEPCVELVELIDLVTRECEKDQGDG